MRSFGEYGRNKIPWALLVGMHNGVAAGENSMVVPKINIELPHDQSIPVLDIYMKETQNTHIKSNTFGNSQNIHL